MCTVTFIPVNNQEFILTHNRDEKLTRSNSKLPKRRSFQGKELIYPVDGDKNGTWFCSDATGKIACILNGAFEKHISKPPYAKSRGIIVLESFLAPGFDQWTDSVKLQGIEPFTLILFEKGVLTEFRWDGKEKHKKNLSTTDPHIWSSATLYSKEAVTKRENWLTDWLNTEPTTPESIFRFHNYGGNDAKETNLKMEILGSHKTVSITQVHITKLHRSMNHINFVSQETTNFQY